MCFTGKCIWEDPISGGCNKPPWESCWLEEEDEEDIDNGSEIGL